MTLPARLDAALCATEDPRLFDPGLPDESHKQREARQAVAVAICHRCPELAVCAATIDPSWDEGVKAGRVIPLIKKRVTVRWQG